MLEVREEDIDRITEALNAILKGRIPNPVELAPDFPENEVKQAIEYLNTFLSEYAVFAKLMGELSRGELDFNPPKGRMHVLQSLKNLHANLRHLTWKTQQIAAGDLSQQVDFMGDFSTAFNTMTQQLKAAFERIEQQNKALSDANEVIRREKEKSDILLLNILPASVADDLKQTGRTTPRLFDDVTVSFSDMVGFTKMSSTLPPQRLIDELNDIFTGFDRIVEANECERIKTIGDAYLAVCGMPEPNERHANNMVRAALEMVRYLEQRNFDAPVKWQMRTGIHTGAVVGGVVGIKKYIYDVFGDTINTASRMESHSEPMKINLSEATYLRVRETFAFEARDPLPVKGKGDMRMYFVT